MHRSVLFVHRKPFTTPFQDVVMKHIYFLSNGAQELQKAITDSGAAEIVAKLPEGLETEMSATFSNLSVGQRQRLVIARAFLRNAPILLLDEPTSALDVRSEELVTEAIGRLRLGRTCVMITHRISTARDADFVVGKMKPARCCCAQFARSHLVQ
jgi:ABC-type multidrug transport system fused ATPase/permease subunit